MYTTISGGWPYSLHRSSRALGALAISLQSASLEGADKISLQLRRRPCSSRLTASPSQEQWHAASTCVTSQALALWAPRDGLPCHCFSGQKQDFKILAARSFEKDVCKIRAR